MNEMVERGAESILSARIDGGPAAAGHARELLTEWARGRGVDTALNDILLLATELVTNAVRHAGVTESGTLELSMAAEPGSVRVSVVDPGGETTPHVQDLDVSVPGGMGLFLVDQISSSWGVDRDAGGTTVWFELAR